MNVSYEGPGSVYSDVAVAGDQIYLSGLIAENLESGELCLGTIEEQTERIMQNLRVMLERHGSAMSKLIRVEIFLTDFSERDRMNAVYVRHFPAGKLPARLCVGVTGLASGCKIEVMAQACR